MLLQFKDMRVRKTNINYIMVDNINVTDIATVWVECPDCEYIVMAEYTGEEDFYTVKVYKDEITETPLVHIEMDSCGGSYADDTLSTGVSLLDSYIIDILFGEGGAIEGF